MSNWSESEVDLIIPIYFEMLKKDLMNQPYNKSEYRRSLLPLLPARSEGAIEFKHQNISAALNEPWIAIHKRLSAETKLSTNIR